MPRAPARGRTPWPGPVPPLPGPDGERNDVVVLAVRVDSVACCRSLSLTALLGSRPWVWAHSWTSRSVSTSISRDRLENSRMSSSSTPVSSKLGLWIGSARWADFGVGAQIAVELVKQETVVVFAGRDGGLVERA